METVKRARKTMRVLLIIPSCFCLLGIVGYFLTDKSGIGAILGLLSCWTIFSAVIVGQAEDAIKTLEREIESLKSGGSADTSDPTPPEDE